jgi:integrase
LSRLTATRASRAKLPRSGQTFLWCDEVRGFGLRLTPTTRSWIVQLRFRGKELRITLGRVGILPCEGPPDRPGARDLAIVALNAARRGIDPREAIGQAKAPRGITLGEVWAAYVKAGSPLLSGTGRKRPKSVESDGYLWRAHVSKLAGEPAAAIDTPRVQRFLDDIEGPGARSHAMILTRTLLAFAKSRGLAATQQIDIKSRPSRAVQNFLKPAELAKLDAALAALAAEKPSQQLGFSALRLMLHTGMRKGEVLSLEWPHVDLEHRVIHLPRDKANDLGRDVLLSEAAVEVLSDLPRLARNDHVFFATRKNRNGRHLFDIRYPWAQALKRAGLRHVRPHDLRHSFASTAIASGISLYTTGKLLGHKRARTSERYAHLSREAQREALDRVADVLGANGER